MRERTSTAGFATALRAALRMEPGAARTVTYGRVRLRAERAPAPGVRLRLAPLAADAPVPVVTVYEAALRRPDGYPAELPFEPGLPVLVATPREGDRRRPWAAWEGVYDAAHLVARLAAASEADGWSPVETAAPGAPPRVVLTRPGLRRDIAATPTSGSPAVMLMDAAG